MVRPAILNSRTDMDKLKSVLLFFKFLGTRKKYWLLPIVIILLALALVIVAAQGSVVAPFIYPLF